MWSYASEKEITTHINTSLQKIDGSAAEKVCWQRTVWAWGAVMDEQPLEFSFHDIKIQGLNMFWHYFLTQMFCCGGIKASLLFEGGRGENERITYFYSWLDFSQNRYSTNIRTRSHFWKTLLCSPIICKWTVKPNQTKPNTLFPLPPKINYIFFRDSGIINQCIGSNLWGGLGFCQHGTWELDSVFRDHSFLSTAVC